MNLGRDIKEIMKARGLLTEGHNLQQVGNGVADVQELAGRLDDALARLLELRTEMAPVEDEDGPIADIATAAGDLVYEALVVIASLGMDVSHVLGMRKLAQTGAPPTKGFDMDAYAQSIRIIYRR